MYGIVRYCVAMKSIKLLAEDKYPKEVCRSSKIIPALCATAKEEVCWYKVMK